MAVGTIVWLSSELMFFAALFAMYFTLRRSRARPVGPSARRCSTSRSRAVNTIVLVLSSVTCQLGVFAAEQGIVPARGTLAGQVAAWGMREWFILTFLMGAIFVAGQIYEYADAGQRGLTLSSDAYGSVFYLTTGFHGLHVTGGLIAFLLVIGRTFAARRFTHEQATAAIVVSYYWHFVDVVWIGLFVDIYLIK